MANAVTLRAIPQLFYDFIEGAEALRLVGYLDSAGKPTWGYGHTGPEVHVGMKISPDVAKADLISDAEVARRRAYVAMTESAILRLTDHQWSAILSFIFNCGEDPKDSIWKAINGGQLDAVPAKLMQYTHEHKDGQVVEVPGLVNRRMAEVALWKAPDASAAVAIVANSPVPPPPSSYTRDAATPPVVAAQPIHPSFMAACGAAICSAPEAIKKASESIPTVMGMIQPYADHSDLVQKALSNLATAGAAMAVTAAVAMWLKHRHDQAHG